MFNHEAAIAEWRQQMRAAGIHSPALEELESHLREELERQLQTQNNEAWAFAAAVAAVGRPSELKQEFRKAGGWQNWLGDNETIRTYRVLGALWLAYCAWIFVGLMAPLASMWFNDLHVGVNATLILVIALLPVFLRGAIASIRLCAGNAKEARIIKFIAVLGLAGLVAQLVVFQTFPPKAIILTGFNIVSLWLLRKRNSNDLKPAA